MIRELAISTLAVLASTAYVRGAGEENEVSAETLKQAEEKWARHLVVVSVWLRRSEGEDPSGFARGRRSPRFSSPRSDSSFDLPYSEKRPAEVVGVAVDPHTVWIQDLGLEARFIARVEAGRPALPAKLHGICLAAPMWVVRTEAPLPGVEAIAFDTAARATDLLAVQSAYTGGGWAFSVAPVAPQLRKLGDAIWVESNRRGAFLVTPDLKAAGFSGSGRLGVESAPYPWRGGVRAAPPLLEFPALGAENSALVKQLDAWVLTIRGFYRREVEADGPPGRRFSYRHMMRQGEDPNELLASGYAVGPRLVLVNHGLNRQSAQRLERVVVIVNGEERPARFAGAFRRFNGFLVELDGEPLAQPMDLSQARPLAISQPLIGLTADHSDNARRPRTTFNRVSSIERGYRNVIEPVLQHFPAPGTVFVDAADKSLRGIIVDVRRDTSADDPDDYTSFAGIDLRLMTPAEVQEVLAQGKGAHDPRLLPLSSEREKDMVWLGIDFQALSPELARSHGVELATRGGNLGVVVLKVHPESPAARMGLVPDDIVLSIRDEEETEPWEIAAGNDYESEDYSDFPLPDEIPEEMQEEFFAQAGPPWRSPRNHINEKLTSIGEGRKVEIVYLHEAREKTATMTLELGPPDFENASKVKIDDLGLTVKELTYEVRGHFRLKPDAPGLVVAKVERGSKAAVAKVMPFEVLSSVNGKPVRGLDELQAALQAARDAGGSIELRLERLGQSRLVRIR